MKILVHSFPEGEQLYTGKCPRCRSVVEAGLSETHAPQQISAYKGPAKRYVKCPNCTGNTVAIYLEEIPKGPAMPVAASPAAPVVPPVPQQGIAQQAKPAPPAVPRRG